ncbi:MAG: phage tail protein [Nitrosomonadaceae bacterium]
MLTGERKIRALSIDSALFPHVGDAITALTNELEWEKIGDDVEDVVAACKESIESWYSDMLIGTVFPWIINPPTGWLLLDGSTYATDDYPELSALLPAHLISAPNFTLPDIENAFPFGALDEDDASTVAGNNVLTLTVGQLPPHNHTYTPPVLTINAETPVVPVPTAGIGSPIATGNTGDGDDIDIRPKRFGLVYAVFAGRE